MRGNQTQRPIRNKDGDHVMLNLVEVDKSVCIHSNCQGEYIHIYGPFTLWWSTTVFDIKCKKVKNAHIKKLVPYSGKMVHVTQSIVCHELHVFMSNLKQTSLQIKMIWGEKLKLELPMGYRLVRWHLS